MSGPLLIKEELSHIPEGTLELLSRTLGLAGLNLLDATQMEHEELINLARHRLGKEALRNPAVVPEDMSLISDPYLLEHITKELEAKKQGGRR